VEPGVELKVAAPAPAPERWNDEKPGSAPAAAVTQTVPPPSGKKTSVLGWTLLGTGVAALGAAGYFGLQALDARKDAEKYCPGAKPGLCWSDAQDPLDRDQRNSLLADVGAGVGVVLAGAGLYFILSAPVGETATAQVTPLPGGGAVRLRGSF
jgi:hypothetical protein